MPKVRIEDEPASKHFEDRTGWGPWAYSPPMEDHYNLMTNYFAPGEVAFAKKHKMSLQDMLFLSLLDRTPYNPNVQPKGKYYRTKWDEPLPEGEK